MVIGVQPARRARRAGAGRALTRRPQQTPPRSARSAWQREGIGYILIQATRPQTLAYGLTDSPVGQLAWIVEKFKEWTDSDRPARGRRRPRPAAHQRDALLAHRHRRLVGPALLREGALRAAGRSRGAVRRADGRRRLPRRDLRADAPTRRGAREHRALDPSSSAAATSRRWSSRPRWSRTSGRSSHSCAKAADQSLTSVVIRRRTSGPSSTSCERSKRTDAMVPSNALCTAG